jgi:hypothetical protein
MTGSTEIVKAEANTREGLFPLRRRTSHCSGAATKSRMIPSSLRAAPAEHGVMPFTNIDDVNGADPKRL